MRVCDRCGRESADDARFCAGCGAPLEAAQRREERKVVSVVFVDLVGSTARAEQLDPEDVRAVLGPYHERVRAELERYGGTVEKFIGDAVVAVFGAPVAHEDDAERAVRAALSAQDAIGGLNEADPTLALEVRVGVNTGEALIAVDARPEAGEAMVSGDVMNTAARLQSAAPPGGVLVGEATYRITERAIEYGEAEQFEARGKAEPVRAWLAIRPRSRFGLDVVQSARVDLVGRERELELVSGALARAREVLEPQLVTLVGVPGIGKSRLVYELWRIVEDDPALIVWRQGRSLPYGEGVAFWALAEMVKGESGIFETDDSAAAAAKLGASVRSLVPGQDAGWVERHLAPLVGLAGSLDMHEERRAETFAAWRRFFEALAERGPSVLVFEDLHWADDGLLDFVDGLVDRVAGVPLLVVCSARPELLERRPGWGGGKRNAATVSLSPLTDEQTARLISSLLDRPVLPADEQRTILQRAGGNPLYAEEYARMLAAGDLDTAEVPETLQGVVTARVDALPAPEKELLQQASVLGKVFWSDALSALSGLDGWLLDERLHALERKEFVRRDHRSAVEGARQYAFVHVLVRDAAYAQMPRAVRARVHEQAADWIEALPASRADERADMLSHHLLEAIEYGRAAGLDVSQLVPRAGPALVAAGDRSWSLGAAARAITFYRQAQALDPALEDDPHVLFRIGRMLLITEGGGGEELERAAGLLWDLDPAAAAQAELIHGEVIWQRGDHEGAFRHFERAREAVQSLPASSEKTFVVGQIARFNSLAGRSREALALAEQAIEMAEQLGDDHLLSDVLNTRGVARTSLGDLGGIGDLERSLELGRESGSPWWLRAQINLGSTLDEFAGDLERAEALLREGLEIAERQELQLSVRWFRGNLASSTFVTGGWDECRDLADLEIANPIPHYLQSSCRQNRGLVLLARGDHERGMEDLETGLAQARQVRDPQALWPSLAGVAFARATSGDLVRAQAALDELEALRRAQPEAGRGGELIALVALAELLLGRAPAARAHHDRQSPWEDAAEAVAAGDLATAAAIFARMGARTYEAYVRLQLARSLAAEGRRAEASRELAAALAFFREVGAGALAREAEALLPAAG
ncbi:MAG TPA: adenylate/guanylate cyclase domain-containing protein [Gaiellaceae bacterium]|nr:adenylate/guanylate cyclase domain-containing protein [Gaiellaceae bacterium]